MEVPAVLCEVRKEFLYACILILFFNDSCRCSSASHRFDWDSVDPPRTGQVFLLVISFFLVKIIPPMFHTRVYLEDAFVGKMNETWELLKNNNLWRSRKVV